MDGPVPSPLSPAGQVRQAGELAAGLRYNRRGRQRALRMLAVLALVCALGTALVFVFG